MSVAFTFAVDPFGRTVDRTRSIIIRSSISRLGRRQMASASSQLPAASCRSEVGGRRASRLCPLSCRSFAAGGFSPSSRFCLQPPARIRSDLSSALSSQTAIHSNSFFPRLDRSSLALCSRISFALMYFIHRILLLVVAVASLARGADEGVSGSADGDSGSSRGIPIVLTPWKVRFACL